MTNQEIYNRYLDCIKNEGERNKIDGIKAVEYINNSTAFFEKENSKLPILSSDNYRGCSFDFLYIPQIFIKETYDYLNKIAYTSYSIMNKVIKEYIDNPEYRKLFNFSPEIEKLILCESGYEEVLPICRLDIFLNEDTLDFKFCEFNADGTSGMNKIREVNNALSQSKVYKQMSQEYKLTADELIYSWIEEFINIYNGYNKAVENPFIAIVDFEESSSPYEIAQFKKCFIERGLDCEICEIRELKFNSGSLYTKEGKKIDAIYRRAVTCEIEAKYTQIPDFIKAIENNAVCCIGSFKTQIIHNKLIFKVFYEDATLSMLSVEEREFIKKHVPATYVLGDNNININEVIESKDKWIIKPQDLFDAKGVYAGVDHNKEEWEKLVKECFGETYLLQEYVQQYKKENINYSENNPKIDLFNNMTGLYIYNGRFAGIYSRAGRGGIIGGDKEEMIMSTLIQRW